MSGVGEVARKARKLASQPKPVPRSVTDVAGEALGLLPVVGALSKVGARLLWGPGGQSWRERIGEESVPVLRTAHVRLPSGVRLRDEPHGDSTDTGILPFDTRVYVERKTEHGWCYVTVLPQQTGPGARASGFTGRSGFVEGQFLLLDPPDDESFLHWVEPGETPAQLVGRYFEPPGGFSPGYDAYLFVGALWQVNKGTLETALGTYGNGMYREQVSLSWTETVPRFAAQEENLRVYLGAKLREGHAVWIPSLELVYELKQAGTIGSASISYQAGYAGGFTRGLIDGIREGLEDLIDDAKRIAKLVYELLTKNFLKVLYELAKKIGKQIANAIKSFDLDKALQAGGEALRAFAAKWFHSDEYVRGDFHGTICGHLLVLALPALLAGGAVALATRSPRLARTLALVSRVMDPADSLVDLARGLKSLESADDLIHELRAARIRGTAEGPNIKWRINPGGVIRTEDEAVEIARKWGVEIPDDIRWVWVDASYFEKNYKAPTYAEYYAWYKFDRDGWVKWEDLYNRFDQIPVRISREILNSDEMIAAVFAHEMYELNKLREYFEAAGGRVRRTVLTRWIVPGASKNSVHERAWDEANELNRKMRESTTKKSK